MAINVNNVYQTVLFILNKEQRGYMTPAEFNKIATQVQLEIFEKYFEDLNQQLRTPQNDSEYANRVKILQENISTFETNETVTLAGGATYLDLPDDLHRLGSIQYEPAGLDPVELEEFTQHDYNLASRSRLTAPTLSFPAFVLNESGIRTYPSIKSVQVYYIKKPKDVVWGYTVGTQGQYIFNNSNNPVDPGVVPSTGSQDFEISSIDQNEVIIKILMYAGVIIRDPQIVSNAATLIAQEDMNEKN